CVIGGVGANFQGTETWSCCWLNHLHALTCYHCLPVLGVSRWDVLTQCFNTVVEVLEHFLHQVLGQTKLLGSNTEIRRDIIRANGLEQMQVGALLEELRAPATIWAKEQAVFTINNGGIQMRNRQWGGGQRWRRVYRPVVL